MAILTETTQALATEFLSNRPEFRAHIHTKLCERNPELLQEITQFLGETLTPNPSDTPILVIPYDQRNDPQDFYYAFQYNLATTARPPDMGEILDMIRDEKFEEVASKISTMDSVALSTPDDYGDMLLPCAIECAPSSMCISILKRMDDTAVLKHSEDGWTILEQALVNDKSEVVEYLTQNRFYLVRTLAMSAIDGSASALHLALRHKNMAFVNYLRTEMPDVFTALANITDCYKSTALRASAYTGADIYEALFELTDPAKIAQDINKNGLTLFHVAASAGNIQRMSLLLGNDHLVSELFYKVDRLNQSVVHTAVLYGSEEMIKLVYQTYRQGAPTSDLTGQDKQHGCNILHLAIKGKNTDNLSTIKMLTEDPEQAYMLANAVDNRKCIPLHYAAMGHPKVFAYLWETYRPTNEQLRTVTHSNGQSILHMAVDGQSTETISTILNHNLGLELAGQEDALGQTPLHLACWHGQTEICQLLYDKMIPDQICSLTKGNTNHSRVTALHLAISRDASDIVSVLLKDPIKARRLLETPDSNGRMPLQYATDKPQIYQLLTQSATE